MTDSESCLFIVALISIRRLLLMLRVIVAIGGDCWRWWLLQMSRVVTDTGVIAHACWCRRLLPTLGVIAAAGGCCRHGLLFMPGLLLPSWVIADTGGCRYRGSLLARAVMLTPGVIADTRSLLTRGIVADTGGYRGLFQIQGVVAYTGGSCCRRWC